MPVSNFPRTAAARCATMAERSLGYIEPFEGLVAGLLESRRTVSEPRHGAGNQVHRTVYPSWDNTARRKHLALVTLNGTPENYEYWLHSAIKDHPTPHDGEGIVFINAWNEWAEGCHLEPDRNTDFAFLEATMRAAGQRTDGLDPCRTAQETRPEAQHDYAASLTGIAQHRIPAQAFRSTTRRPSRATPSSGSIRRSDPTPARRGTRSGAFSVG